MIHNKDMKMFCGNNLIVYYSRTGHCQKIAQYLSQLIDADIDRLHDKQDYTGTKGFFICAGKALFRRPTALAATKYDPDFYDDIILVSPIWAGKTCPAIRTYVQGRADKMTRVSLITCSGLSTKKGVRKELAHDYGLDLARTVGVTIDEVDNDVFGIRLRAFIRGTQETEDIGIRDEINQGSEATTTDPSSTPHAESQNEQPVSDDAHKDTPPPCACHATQPSGQDQPSA